MFNNISHSGTKIKPEIPLHMHGTANFHEICEYQMLATQTLMTLSCGMKNGTASLENRSAVPFTGKYHVM